MAYVVQRKVRQAIRIGNVVVTVRRITAGNKVRLVVEAPSDVRIERIDDPQQEPGDVRGTEAPGAGA